MSRSIKQPIYKDKGYRKQDYWRAIRSTINNKVRQILSLNDPDDTILPNAKEIINDYDYVGVFDCESEFVKNCNLDVIYEDITSHDYVKANESKIGANIVKLAAGYMGLDTNERLISETKNYSLYWWFSEIPVYTKELFIEFYNWYKANPNLDILQSEYYAFDYLVYVIWLVCFKNYKNIVKW